MPDYKSLASLMGDHQDVTIFRRFRKMNLQSMLYMQAELVHLEQEFYQLQEEDSQSDDPARRLYRTNWKAMEKGFKSGGDTLQREKILEVREKLEKYNGFLLAQAKISTLSSPETQSLEVLREWLSRPNYGNNFLQGFERRTWDAERDDLVTLQTENEDHHDPLTRWLQRVIPGFFHNRWGHRWKSRVHDQEMGSMDVFTYNDSTFAKFTTAVTTILSTVFPVVSIFVLYYIENMPVRLGLILVFTSLFALALLFVSRARRVEIFMATSAFAAVQVVFIGNT